MSPGLIVLTAFGLGILGCLAALLIAELRARGLPLLTYHRAPRLSEDEEDRILRIIAAAEVLYPDELEGRLRVEVQTRAGLSHLGERIDATVEQRQAWSPWGWRYWVVMPSAEGITHALVVHELAHHIVPQVLGLGLNRDHAWKGAHAVEQRLAEVAGLFER